MPLTDNCRSLPGRVMHEYYTPSQVDLVMLMENPGHQRQVGYNQNPHQGDGQ